MKRNKLAAFLALTLCSHSLWASDSTYHSGQASKHSSIAGSQVIGSTAVVASAVVAAPVVVSVGASMAAESAAKESAESAARHHRYHTRKARKLVITDVIVTADPAPNQVIVINNP